MPTSNNGPDIIQLSHLFMIRKHNGKTINSIAPIPSQRHAMTNMKIIIIVGIRCIKRARIVSPKP